MRGSLGSMPEVIRASPTRLFDPISLVPMKPASKLPSEFCFDSKYC